MKKNTTTKKSPKKAQTKEKNQIHRMAAKQKLTIGIDLGDQTSRYCIFADEDDPVSEGQLPTTKAGLDSLFAKMPASRIAVKWGRIRRG